MSRGNPSVLDDGHGPFSSADERVGGLAGALLLGGTAYAATENPWVGALGAGIGWWVGEGLDD